VEKVSFGYPGAEATVLADVSWLVRPGETVAFVGESGAGKTTMLDLVTGLLDPTAGRITIDGVPLTELDVEAWQSHIGLVLQESPLFHATVRANVVGDRAEDEELVWSCLAAAHARGVVEELPSGLDTVIGERGGRLSGGQRQRLGLARALYREPWLLILDEATSALDSLSESLVLEALRGLHGNVSMMIVAHRLATVEMADRIYVLDAGRVVQSGSWSELLADTDGPFARIAAKQGLLVPGPQ
jgi:ABC-type multidrug transport system fused ATPase/permease subunit